MNILDEIAEATNGKIEEIGRLPDGSGFATMSMPLPKDHWLYGDGANAPPMPFRMGTGDPRRVDFSRAIQTAARYAIRAATMNGKETDFDPDAMVQNFVVAMLGYYTRDGLCRDTDVPAFDPSPVPPVFGGEL